MKSNNYNLGLLILRVGFSALMLTHGWGKMLMLFEGKAADFGSVMGMPPLLSLILAVIGEVVAPVMIILGIKTRLAAIPAAITMAVAAFVIHGPDPLSNKEHALLYLIAFVTIGLTGAGKYSIDGRRG